jgi:hypothetical protein
MRLLYRCYELWNALDLASARLLIPPDLVGIIKANRASRYRLAKMRRNWVRPPSGLPLARRRRLNRWSLRRQTRLALAHMYAVRNTRRDRLKMGEHHSIA